jgi:hypothetical protein
MVRWLIWAHDGIMARISSEQLYVMMRTQCEILSIDDFVDKPIYVCKFVWP